jgi:hypothetical protein
MKHHILTQSTTDRIDMPRCITRCEVRRQENSAEKASAVVHIRSNGLHLSQGSR